MIFPTTFILALFLAHTICAVPRAYRDPIVPESSTLDRQYKIMDPELVHPGYKAYFNPVYDNGNNPLSLVACSNLDARFPEFKDVPIFPYIGGAPNTTYDSKNCGAIWEITNEANGRSIRFTGIDNADGFVLSLAAFEKLGGKISTGHVDVEAKIVHEFCGN